MVISFRLNTAVINTGAWYEEMFEERYEDKRIKNARISVSNKGKEDKVFNMTADMQSDTCKIKSTIHLNLEIIHNL